MEEDLQNFNWAIIFFADAIFFFLTTFYVNNVIRSESLKAGIVAAMQNFSSYLALYFFVRNFGYILPACAGAFLGTYLATEYNRRQQKSQRDEVRMLRLEVESLKKELQKIKQQLEGGQTRVEKTKKVIKIH